METTSTTTGQKVSGFYEDDHDRLDHLFKQFQELKRTHFSLAKTAFTEFKFGLQRHIIWEEEILFPLFERKTGLTQGGPTHVMRMEHRLIGKYLEEIHQKVKAGNTDSEGEEQMLLNTLFAHNQKEEQILYPAIDRTLSDSEREGIFKTMRELPEARYQHCCNPATENKS
ncbi:MAG TPA: hemerythrin domain-containing protein [Bacteroidota bacterium]|jgi:iron-sulfur cluster repair protein YtfE (RIC family)|nr:hemerythrin domain-containing protein [Bacteroidota bacterium]